MSGDFVSGEYCKSDATTAFFSEMTSQFDRRRDDRPLHGGRPTPLLLVPTLLPPRRLMLAAAVAILCLPAPPLREGRRGNLEGFFITS